MPPLQARVFKNGEITPGVPPVAPIAPVLQKPALPPRTGRPTGFQRSPTPPIAWAGLVVSHENWVKPQVPQFKVYAVMPAKLTS